MNLCVKNYKSFCKNLVLREMNPNFTPPKCGLHGVASFPSRTRQKIRIHPATGQAGSCVTKTNISTLMLGTRCPLHGDGNSTSLPQHSSTNTCTPVSSWGYHETTSFEEHSTKLFPNFSGLTKIKEQLRKYRSNRTQRNLQSKCNVLSWLGP